MPPARTIIVDTARILRSIAKQAAQQHADALARTEHYREQERREVLALAVWVPRNLAHLAGKPLTASERKRHQEAIRKMAVDGLVATDARHVRLTDAGRAYVDGLKNEIAING